MRTCFAEAALCLAARDAELEQIVEVLAKDAAHRHARIDIPGAAITSLAALAPAIRAWPELTAFELDATVGATYPTLVHDMTGTQLHGFFTYQSGSSGSMPAATGVVAVGMSGQQSCSSPAVMNIATPIKCELLMFADRLRYHVLLSRT